MIELKNVSKTYKVYKNEIKALQGISLTIQNNDMVAIVGASGSGKSTLLNILGGLDRPTDGNYYFDGTNVSNYNMAQLHQFRKNHVGFVFQNFALINRYTVYENMEVPLLARNQKNYKKKIMECIEKLGLAEYVKTYPQYLSGGQQQRCAIGRALMTECDLLLCDEPTGALDRKTGNEIIDVLGKAKSEGKTIVIVTHDLRVAARCDRQVNLEDGMILT